jgi:hypothetical protein
VTDQPLQMPKRLAICRFGLTKIALRRTIIILEPSAYRLFARLQDPPPGARPV